MSDSTTTPEPHVCPIVGHCFGCFPREEREAEWMERTALPYATVPLLAALEATGSNLSQLVARAIDTMPPLADRASREAHAALLRTELTALMQGLRRVAEIVQRSHVERLPPTRYERQGDDTEDGAPSP